MSTETVKPPRKFVVCCDGTWLNSDNGWKPPSIIPWNPEGHVAPPSNVTRLSRALKPVDSEGRPQVTYYQAGLGTGWTISNQIFGGALGLGLSQNIREAYDFIATNHCAGDEIFLTGFSRGAFTARSVGGLVSSMGLLEKWALKYFYVVFEDWENTYSKEYKVKATGTIPGFKLSVGTTDPTYQQEYMAELKRLGMTREVMIKAIGVWDTVGALGIPLTPWVQAIGFPTSIKRFKFYDTALDNHVENAFQALALDERRAPYVPCIWNKQDGSTTNLVQCWFPGVHSNIGGSYENDGLGAITLAWMLSKLSPFLEFEPDVIEQVWAEDQAALQAQGELQRYEAWGMGKIINSARFPRSLLGVTTRTPGNYHKVDLMTGRPILTQPKLRTNELVHASVRARIQGNGTKIGGLEKGYQPEALESWKMAPAGGKDVPYGKGEWVHTGKSKDEQLELLPEDELGVFELELMRKTGMSV